MTLGSLTPPRVHAQAREVSCPPSSPNSRRIAPRAPQFRSHLEIPRQPVPGPPTSVTPIACDRRPAGPCALPAELAPTWGPGCPPTICRWPPGTSSGDTAPRPREALHPGFLQPSRFLSEGAEQGHWAALILFSSHPGSTLGFGGLGFLPPTGVPTLSSLSTAPNMPAMPTPGWRRGPHRLPACCL